MPLDTSETIVDGSRFLRAHIQFIRQSAHLYIGVFVDSANLHRRPTHCTLHIQRVSGAS